MNSVSKQNSLDKTSCYSKSNYFLNPLLAVQPKNKTRGRKITSHKWPVLKTLAITLQYKSTVKYLVAPIATPLKPLVQKKEETFRTKDPTELKNHPQ